MGDPICLYPFGHDSRFSPDTNAAVKRLRVTVRNNSERLRRIMVCLQGTSTYLRISGYMWINAVDGL